MIAYATLAPDSTRRAAWRAAFGSDRVRIATAEPEVIYLPGVGPRRCYRGVDVPPPPGLEAHRDSPGVAFIHDAPDLVVEIEEDLP